MAEETFLGEVKGIGLDFLREYGRQRLMPPPPPPAPPPPPPPEPSRVLPTAAFRGTASNIGAQLLDIIKSPRFLLIGVVIGGGIFLFKKMSR